MENIKNRDVEFVSEMDSETEGYPSVDVELSEDFRKSVVYYSCDEKTKYDLSQRKLYINYGIDDSIIDDIVYNILDINSQDKNIPIEERKPIILYVSSFGGSVVDGFSVIDVIMSSKTPIYTVNLSYCYSMGFLIYLAGHKRFSSKNATYLLHDGQNFAWNSSAKLIDQVEFSKIQEKRIKEYVLSQSCVSEKLYDEKYRVEWYMFADEAKSKGFCQYIIGEDCELDSII